MTEEVDKHLLRKYEVAQKLGKGAYGIVWKAYDKKTKETVALKKIFDAFQNATDAQRTYREVVFLSQMGNHENIVMLHHVFRADNDRDLYLVFEYMETDLHAVIRANILEDIHKQYIMYQSFKALMYMHSAQLVHRDMKPSNLLLNSECLMKVADFGLARSLRDPERSTSPDDPAEHMTDYVATRWYRAPEIITGWSHYGKAVDMWAVGCVLAELLGRKPIFPGSNSQHQLELICQCLGKPSAATIAKIQSMEIQDFVREIPDVPRVQLRDLYPHAKEDACRLLDALMRFDPDYRCTVVQALEHEYLSQLHYPDDEPSGPEIDPAGFDFERASHTGEELKKEILHEIWLYHRERMASTAVDAGEAGAAEPFSNLRETFQKALPDAK